MSREKQQNAKFAFYYMLSLAALIFTAVPVGIIIFQIINKNIIDAINPYRGRYSSQALKFAISALIIAAPIYFLTVRQIYVSLRKGVLDKDSAVRRWLVYFILFVTSVVMLGWLVAVINNFLGGELTIKVVLKALTAIIIAVIIFTFYLYDIRREEVVGKKDKMAAIYFYGSLALTAAAFAASLLTVESPALTRNLRYDNEILSRFNQIDSALRAYYQENDKLPDSLEALLEPQKGFLSAPTLENPLTRERFIYRLKNESQYELCADFKTSNKMRAEDENYYYGAQWPHQAGFQCLGNRVDNIGDFPLKPRPAPAY